jgi:IS1 family transposase
VGRRETGEAWKFAAKLNRATTGRFQLSTDGYTPYTKAMPVTFGNRIDFMQIVKHYGKTSDEPQHRYSPAKITGVTYEYQCGSPKVDRASTSIVERGNLSLRMGLRRMTRLTNGASKKWDNHRYALAIWFAYYNFCRRHSSIKQTPAMALGIADHEWTIRELLDRIATP